MFKADLFQPVCLQCDDDVTMKTLVKYLLIHSGKMMNGVSPVDTSLARTSGRACELFESASGGVSPVGTSLAALQFFHRWQHGGAPKHHDPLFRILIQDV